MKKALSLIMVFAIAGICSTAAHAADKYVSGSIGISWINDIDAEVKRNSESQKGATFEIGSGVTFLGAAGCDYGDYRVEAELGYQSGDIDTMQKIRGPKRGQGDGPPAYDINGDISLYSLMLNGYYDIALGKGVELSPYIGAGFSHILLESNEALFEYDPEPYNNDYEAVANTEFDATAFSYQAGLVLAIPVADNIMLDARYRYFATLDFSVTDTVEDYDTETNKYTMNVESHSMLLGLRVGL
ncbi:MAG: porin family protein [Prosthecochloris sp.]|nr:porin family protein [Prosthecochloris sp.]